MDVLIKLIKGMTEIEGSTSYKIFNITTQKIRVFLL